MPSNFEQQQLGIIPQTSTTISSSSIIQPHVLPGLGSATENIANTSSNHQTSTITTMSFCRSQDPTLSLDERLRILYPMVNEDETPLPRCWSTKDKFNFIGLSQNNLRVQYKGNGKSHKEASSVRATHPIPASCGIYYFEVKIVSKGRDGYMGVGLSAQGVNMNRLPGWDKHSYGYHGDDGNSFCSSGTGQAYGPTFTTNDIIGCGLNLIDRSCFYTKNGHNLGVAFTDLPAYLYPTVGLQTPGEVVDANFGQEPFVFDIEGEMYEYKTRIHRMVEQFPPPGKHGDWQLLLHKMVSSYLIHQGFSSTAEAFARTAGQDIDEDISSIQNRQAIQKLVLAGRMGDAIAMTNRLYPGFLQLHPSLHFMLKVRQFIEMVSGHDVADSDIVTNGLWNNSAVINSASPYHSVQPVHEPNNTGALSNIMTDSASRNASTENMQGGTSEPRASPATTTIAINTSSAPHSLTPDDNSNPAGNVRGSIAGNSQGPSDDTIMDSQIEGHVSSSPISSSTVPNGSSASNSSSNSGSCEAARRAIDPSNENNTAALHLPSGSPSQTMRPASNSQEREEQMQTGTEHNILFRPSSSQGPAADRQSSSPSFQNPQLVSQRAGEITDDDDLPQVSTLQRESSSEGVFEVDDNQMEIDQHSSPSSSSTTASVPAALATSSQSVTTVTASSSNIKHQNGFESIANGGNERDGITLNSGPFMNGNLNTNNSTQNNVSTPEADSNQQRSFSVVSNPERFNRLLVFGRQLQAMLTELETTRGIKSDKNTKMLQDAFALLAYPDPWESPLGWQLEASEREFVSSSLNSAILESQCNQPGRPPVQVSLTHAKQLVKLMANNDLGACAFANVDDFLK
jgi:hypothetical protein